MADFPANVKTNQNGTIKKITIQMQKNRRDTTVCDIIGITELPGGRIVLVDKSNCRVKVLDRKYKVIVKYTLPEEPHDICHIVDQKVAVAADTHKVHILTVSDDDIEMTNDDIEMTTFAVDHDCYSIGYHGGQLYVSSLTALYLYTTEGMLVRTVYEDPSGIGTMNRFALSTDGNKIYIPVSRHNKVLTIDTTGNILATLQDPVLNWPFSVHVNEDGHVFVCSHHSHTVMQVDQEGERILTTLARREDGISFPQAVWYCTRTRKLFVMGRSQNKFLMIELE